MNKEQLKSFWGKYVNTDKLVDDVTRLLNQYGHANTEHGVCVMLHGFFTQKEPLIKLMIQSPHYIGGLRISSVREFERDNNPRLISEFCRCFIDNIRARDAILSTVDDNGKTISDYLHFGSKSFNVMHMPQKTIKNHVVNRAKDLSNFDMGTGYTIKSENILSDLDSDIGYFVNQSTSTLSSSYTAKTGIKIVKGTKTSRAFHAVCTSYGLNKIHPIVKVESVNGENRERITYPYDKLFAQYADMVSSSTRHLNFIISANPLDYLTMSFGVNWHSCHSINGGIYQGGTLSYMLDNSSLVTFVTDTLEGEIHKIGKIYREMIHVSGTTIAQSRIYPQCKDGATDLYVKFGDYIIDEFNSMFKLNSDTQWMTVNDANHNITFIHNGAHYKDLMYHRQCRLMAPEIDGLETSMYIGHEGICPKCGNPINNSGRFVHSYCQY